MKTVIIGGGLSGLALAEALHADGSEICLVEARPRLGGRIETMNFGGSRFDLGPAWFWPGQPRLAAMTDRFGLTRFDQNADGDLIFEDDRGQVERGRGFASMQGSWRLDGGFAALVDALSARLPHKHIRLGTAATRIAVSDGKVRVTLANGESISGDRVVLAMPPRLVAGLDFAPALPEATVEAFRRVPTWMAGQAKAVALYDAPFWRRAGLSGDAMSRHGPMVEIHDASTLDGETAALFGFIGVPPKARADAKRLRQSLLDQLIRLFGPQAANPVNIIIKDWAADPWTATDADFAPLFAHPVYQPSAAPAGPWATRLHFAGTEFAPDFGGYLEGALEAAERVARHLRLQEAR